MVRYKAKDKSYSKANMVNLNHEQITEIIKRYEAGESPTSLSKAFNVNHTTIRSRLTQAGVRLRTFQESLEFTRKLSTDQITEMLSLYKSGSSPLQLATRYSISRECVRYHLKNEGAALRTRAEARRKHTLNESVFDFITEESAYWIGFLMADGCVYETKKGSPRISLVLAKWDIIHLEAFRSFLGTTCPIHNNSTNGNAFSLAVSSNKLAKSLAGYGITPRKSLAAKVIGLEYDKHFWRGVVDGDGSISDIKKYSNLKDKKRIRLTLLGSKSLMEQFALFTESITSFKPKPWQRGNIFVVNIRGKNAARMINILYGNCSIALPRKLERAKRIIVDLGRFLECKCQRCGHDWFPSTNNPDPRTCSNCRSTLWKIQR